MLLTEIIIITIAIAADSFITAWYSGAIHFKLQEKLTSKMPVSFFAGRTIAITAGVASGTALLGYIGEYSYFFGILLMILIGLKFVIEMVKFIPEEKIILIDNNKTLLLLTIAGSINTYFIGMGLGLAGADIKLPVIVTAIATLGLSFSGKFLGQKMSLRPEVRYTGILAGLIILALSLRLTILYFFY